MTNVNDKFWAAIKILKSDIQCTASSDILTEDNFNNNINWNTGVNSNGIATTTTTCPHSEITWTKLKAEMDKL